MQIVPNHQSDLYEVNHCHGKGTKGHPCVQYVPEGSDILKRNAAAGVYSAPEHTIYINDRYQGNEHLLNHETGHALMHNKVQPSEWAEPMREDPALWREFLSTSVGRSYVKRPGGNVKDPWSIDWVEAQADLYMAWKAGRLDKAPRLLALLQQNLAAAERR